MGVVKAMETGSKLKQSARANATFQVMQGSENKICAYCLLRLGNATTTRNDGTMIHIMCDVHHSTMGVVVVTKTTSVQCKIVSDAVKVGTTHLDLKKSLEQNGVFSMMTMVPVLILWQNGFMIVAMVCASSSFMEAAKAIKTSFQQGMNVN